MAEEVRRFVSYSNLIVYDDKLKEWVRAQVPTTLSDLTDDLGSNPVHTHSQYLTASAIANKPDLSDLAIVATSGSYNDLQDTPEVISAFRNDSGYITEVPEIPKQDINALFKA